MQKTETSEAVPLQLENLQGVFVVLLCGTIFALVYGPAEAFFHIYRKAKSEKVWFFSHFIPRSHFIKL